MKKMRLFLSLTILALLYSCGGKKADQLKVEEVLESYIAKHESVVLYGAVDYNSIINKADLKGLPQFGSVISSTLDSLNMSLPDGARVYFASENEDMDDRQPSEKGILLLQIKDKKAFLKQFADMGYTDVSTDENISLFEDGKQLIVINESMAIAFFNPDFGDDPDAFVKKFFKEVSKNKEDEVVNEVLQDKSDIVFCTRPSEIIKENIANDVKGVSERQKKLTLEYLKDAHFKTSVSFEDGQAVFTSKSYVNDKLKNALFLSDNDNDDLLTKLGPIDASWGFCVNIDVEKMEALAKNIDPKILEKILKISNIEPTIGTFINSQGLSAFINGEFAVVGSGLGEKLDSIDYVSAYVGLGSNAKAFINGFKNLTMDEDLNTTPTGEFLIGKNMLLKEADKYLLFKKMKNENYTEGDVNLPSWASGFGQKPITGFIDISAIPQDAIIEMKIQDVEFAIDALEYIYLEGDNLESKIVIKAKNGEENILKQLVDSFLENSGF